MPRPSDPRSAQQKQLNRKAVKKQSNRRVKSVNGGNYKKSKDGGSYKKLKKQRMPQGGGQRAKSRRCNLPECQS